MAKGFKGIVDWTGLSAGNPRTPDEAGGGYSIGIFLAQSKKKKRKKKKRNQNAEAIAAILSALDE